MRIMMVGDVVGRTGRRAFRKFMPELRREHSIDVVVVNGENSAGGKGITRKSLDELYQGGADIVTSGNHVFDKKDVLDFIDDEPFLIRPANYPEGAPGKGMCVYPFKAKNIGVMNLSGRSFMPALDCPFQKAEHMIQELWESSDIILLDFHAETTSEKLAMANFLDGRVTAVVGTHTHVQTADECILPKGTAYITDLGMTGPIDSVLGVKKEIIIDRFRYALPARFDVAEGPAMFCGILLTIDDATNRAERIERFFLRES